MSGEINCFSHTFYSTRVIPENVGIPQSEV